MRSLGYGILFAIVLVSTAAVPSSARTPTTQVGETATQFYLRWRSTALNAKSADEITAFWTAEARDQFTMEPDSAKADMPAMLKRFYAMQTDVKVVKETATPAGATLSLEALDRDKKPLVSSIDIVKEKGAWKMTGAVEQWKPKGN